MPPESHLDRWWNLCRYEPSGAAELPAVRRRVTGRAGHRGQGSHRTARGTAAHGDLLLIKGVTGTGRGPVPVTRPGDRALGQPLDVDVDQHLEALIVVADREVRGESDRAGELVGR